MVDLVFRPVFLEAGRLAREHDPDAFTRGDFSFTAPSGASSIESAFALFLSIRGPECPWHFDLSGPTLTIFDGFGLRIVLNLLPGSSWQGGGWLDCQGLRLDISLDGRDRSASGDRLVACRNGGRAFIQPLAEGDGPLYADLDEAECQREGRESGILPPEWRRIAAERASGIGMDQ